MSRQMYYVLCVSAASLSSHGSCAQTCQMEWNGTIGQPGIGPYVNHHIEALCEFRGALIAGGDFFTAGGQATDNIALWNGATWQPLGLGTESTVSALCNFNGDLIAGGWFKEAGGQPADYVARWDGTSWHSVGTDIPNIAIRVVALQVFRGELIAGGIFSLAGNPDANRIARWDGATWRSVGTGTSGEVSALTVFGDNLIAGGSFTSAGGQTVNHIARWNGLEWRPLGTGMTGNVAALTTYNGELIAGGLFSDAGGQTVHNIARWDGTNWRALGGGLSGEVRSLTTFNGELVAGGHFSSASGQPAANIALWNGSNWTAVGNGTGGSVNALLAFQDRLVVGGKFSTAGGLAANDIAEWGGCGLDVLDPNYPGTPLIANGLITSNYSALASNGRPAGGLAADGITRLVLRLAVPGPGTVTLSLSDEQNGTADVGMLSSPGGSENTASLARRAILVNGNWMAVAVLRAPPDFARSSSDNALISRPINITAQFTPSGSGTPTTITHQISLSRPPVLLLHGLWSSAGTWVWGIENDSRFTVYAHDYSGAPAAQSLAANASITRNGVAAALQRLRAQGIACTQADVVGHSMGGLLARLYVANTPLYVRNDNFNAGDIHKLITLDTPHQGSSLANVLLSPAVQSTGLGTAINYVLGCITCGAVADLRPETAVPQALNVKSHALVGTGGPAFLALGISALPVANKPLWYTLSFISQLALFGAQTHDLIVSESSQKGGLDTPKVTEYGFSGLPWQTGIHFFGVTHDDQFSNRVVDLLNTRTSDVAFADSLPPWSGATNRLGAPPPPRRASGGITITSPLAGAAFAPGQTIIVSTAATGGFVPQRVLILSNHDGLLVEQSPFQAELTIPTDAIGLVTLRAFAFDANGAFAESSPVVVQVNTSATLTSLLVSPQPVYVFKFAPSQRVTVTGTYSDGVQRDVSSSCTFTSLNPSIATVTGDGTVTSVHVGVTTVTATIGAISASCGVSVISLPCPGDTNGSGVVDVNDLLAVISAWGPCMPGPTGCPADVAPPPNGDGMVNVNDLLAVIMTWGTCPQ